MCWVLAAAMDPAASQGKSKGEGDGNGNGQRERKRVCDTELTVVWEWSPLMSVSVSVSNIVARRKASLDGHRQVSGVTKWYRCGLVLCSVREKGIRGRPREDLSRRTSGLGSFVVVEN
jgi:hypothetical protein